MSLLYVIGGGELGLPALDWAIEEGLTLAVTDKDPGAPGLKKAKYKLVADALDTESHLQFAEHIQKAEKDVRGVICVSDERACSIRTELQVRFDVPHPPRLAVRGALNKAVTHKELEMSGLPVPKTTFFPHGCVKKPTDGSGSVGVEIFEGHILVQEFLKGRNIDANGIFLEGDYYPCGVGERYIEPGRHAVTVGGRDPAKLGREQALKVHELLERASRAIGVTEGPVKGDFLFTTSVGLVILEITPRFHGEIWTTWACVYGSGINAWKFYFKWMASGKIDESLIKPQKSTEAIWRLAQEPDPSTEGKCVVRWLKHPRRKLGKPPYKDNNEIPGYECYQFPT